MNYSKIKTIAEKAGIKQIELDCSTAGLCSIRAGGRAAALATVGSGKKLLHLLTLLESQGLPYTIIGGGTNIVFTRPFLDMVLIKLGRQLGKVEIDEPGKITAGAAAGMQPLVKKAAASGLDLAFMAGIPGTLGGAVAGNSGSCGSWICGSITSLEYIRRTGRGFRIEKCGTGGIKAGYRSLDISGMIAVISAVLEPAPADKDLLASKISREMDRRRRTQPVGAWTSGCFFKNPTDHERPAGALIDGCGLKGFSYGGARVSPVHANFIENFRSASAEDIVVLSKIIMDKVRQKYGILLEYEVKLVGKVNGHG